MEDEYSVLLIQTERTVLSAKPPLRTHGHETEVGIKRRVIVLREGTICFQILAKRSISD